MKAKTTSRSRSVEPALTPLTAADVLDECDRLALRLNPEVVVDLKSSLNGMVIALISTIRQIDVATAHEVLKLIPSRQDYSGIGARLVESNATGREARGIVARSLARDVLMMYVADPEDFLAASARGIRGIDEVLRSGLPTVLGPIYTALSNTMLAVAGTPGEVVVDSIIDNAQETSFTRWQRRPRLPPLYGSPAASYLTVGGTLNSTLSPEEEERAWNSVLALDEETLITYVYVMSRWLAEGGQDKVRIHVNDLLALRERARHHSRDFKPEQKRAQRDQLLALRNKWITVKEAITVKHGKGTRKKVVNVSSPLIEIAIESEDDATGLISLPLVGELPESPPYAFRIGLGDWAKVFLEADRGYIMPLMKTIASYDPKQGVEKMAVRLAIKLSGRWNSLSMNGRAKQRWTFQELLDEARIPVPKVQPGRFREQVESALDRLTKDGVIGRWCEDPDAFNEALPERGWMKRWLLRCILIAPPDQVKAFYGGTDPV